MWEIRAADLSISPVHKSGVGLVSLPFYVWVVSTRARTRECPLSLWSRTQLQNAANWIFLHWTWELWKGNYTRDIASVGLRLSCFIRLIRSREYHCDFPAFWESATTRNRSKLRTAHKWDTILWIFIQFWNTETVSCNPVTRKMKWVL